MISSALKRSLFICSFTAVVRPPEMLFSASAWPLQIRWKVGRLDLVVQISGGNDLRPFRTWAEAYGPPAQTHQHRQIDHRPGRGYQ